MVNNKKSSSIGQKIAAGLTQHQIIHLLDVIFSLSDEDTIDLILSNLEEDTAEVLDHLFYPRSLGCFYVGATLVVAQELAGIKPASTKNVLKR